jgi:hypothetical protein
MLLNLFLEMVPSISARYASLYETIVDDCGKNYIAKLINGEMAWVSNENPGCPTISADLMSVNDVLVGTDNKEYIVGMSNNIKYWSLKKNKITKMQSKYKDQTDKSNGHPVISADIMSVGDILVGTDGNEYIVKVINGQKQYIVHQKIYKWSKSGVLYTTLESSTTNDNGYNSRQQMSSKKSSKKINK